MAPKITCPGCSSRVPGDLSRCPVCRRSLSAPGPTAPTPASEPAAVESAPEPPAAEPPAAEPPLPALAPAPAAGEPTLPRAPIRPPREPLEVGDWANAVLLALSLQRIRVAGLILACLLFGGAIVLVGYVDASPAWGFAGSGALDSWTILMQTILTPGYVVQLAGVGLILLLMLSLLGLAAARGLRAVPAASGAAPWFRAAVAAELALWPLAPGIAVLGLAPQYAVLPGVVALGLMIVGLGKLAEALPRPDLADDLRGLRPWMIALAATAAALALVELVRPWAWGTIALARGPLALPALAWLAFAVIVALVVLSRLWEISHELGEARDGGRGGPWVAVEPAPPVDIQTKLRTLRALSRRDRRIPAAEAFLDASATPAPVDGRPVAGREGDFPARGE